MKETDKSSKEPREKLEIVWVRYTCTTIGCISRSMGIQNFELAPIPSNQKEIPETIPCPACGGVMMKE